MKSLIHKLLSLITKTWIRGLDAFNLPFLVIDDNTKFWSDKSVQVNFIHKA